LASVLVALSIFSAAGSVFVFKPCWLLHRQHHSTMVCAASAAASAEVKPLMEKLLPPTIVDDAEFTSSEPLV
jgi:hypothetical protein